MPEDELVAELVADIGDVELPLFACYLGIEDDMEQDVTQFLLDVGNIVLEQGIAKFKGLFYGIWAQAFVGLFSVPGAFLPKFVHDIQQTAKRLQFLFSGIHL